MKENGPQSVETSEPTRRRAGGDHTGLQFGVAETLKQVIEAWRLVYLAYRRIDLVAPNPHRIHTAPQAVTSNAAIITGRIGPVTVATLTAMVDGPGGLPLDRVYRDELDRLRRDGRKVMEFGLFADRRQEFARTAESLFELMRYAFYFGLHEGVTDLLIGAHPRHARFYGRAFGFEKYGEPRTYAAVNDAPVVLVRADLKEKLETVYRLQHAVVEYYMQTPVEREVFDRRCMFEADELGDSRIERFVADQAASREHRAAG